MTDIQELTGTGVLASLRRHSMVAVKMTDRLEECGMDSLELLEAVNFLQEQFDVTIQPEAVQGTIGDLVRHVEAAIALRG